MYEPEYRQLILKKFNSDHLTKINEKYIHRELPYHSLDKHYFYQNQDIKEAFIAPSDYG